jgi:UTP--glucose-1-phosphate uridylyltransferase
MVRKAVIPAAGLGTRFLPATKAQPKEMLPLVDKPAIQYVVEEAVRAGLHDILVITGRGKRTLEDHFDRSLELEQALAQGGREADARAMRDIADLAKIHYVRQGDPKGLGHAVGVAREHVGDEPFAVLLPDDLMAESSHVLEQMVAASERTGASVIALKQFPPEEISLYGCPLIDPVGDDDELVRIRGLVEKPRAEDAPSNLAIMGRYVLTPAIFDCIERVPPGRGGEIQLTDAMAMLLEREPLWGLRFTAGRYDTGNKLDWLRATVELALLREDLGPGFRKYLGEVAKREGLT